MDEARRDRAAVAAIFLVHGGAAGSLAARVPWVQDRLQLSPGALGLALLMPAVGSVAALPLSGRLVARHGSKRVTRVALVALCAVVGALTAVPRLPWVMTALLLFGVAGAVTDVAMNANAVAVEGRLGRPVMSGLHAMWSLGSLLGGAVGALAAHAGLGAPVHLAVAAGALCAAALLVGPALLDVPGSGTAQAVRFALPSRDVVLLGLLCAAAMFAEGAANEWSAVFAHRVDGVDPGTAAIAFTAFALAMVAGRLMGDRVVARHGSVRALRVAGGVAAAGCALVAAVHALPVTVAGFALLGLGLAVAVPLSFGAAGHGAGERSGHAIAAVATVGYGGWLAAPAVIGGVAQLSSLPTAFVVVAAVAALIVPLATTTRGR
ncbi:MAG: MFS transporter [Frankiaceae bacterium]